MRVDLSENQAMTLMSIEPGSYVKGTVKVSFRAEDGTSVTFHVNRLIWNGVQNRFVKERNEVPEVVKTRRNGRNKKTQAKLQKS